MIPRTLPMAEPISRFRLTRAQANLEQDDGGAHPGPHQPVGNPRQAKRLQEVRGNSDHDDKQCTND